MVLPYINMNPPQVYTCSPSWTLLPSPCLYHPSGSSQCTSPKHPGQFPVEQPRAWAVCVFFKRREIQIEEGERQGKTPWNTLVLKLSYIYNIYTYVFTCDMYKYTSGGGLVAKSCPTRDFMDRGAWQTTVYEILQARILEWVAISFSKIYKYMHINKYIHAYRLLQWTDSHNTFHTFLLDHLLSHKYLLISLFCYCSMNSMKSNALFYNLCILRA